MTTKTHLACEQGRKPLAMVITGGQRGDSPEFIPVLRKIRVKRVGGGRPRTRPDLVLADKAYTSKGNRGHLRARIKACIPSMADRLFRAWCAGCGAEYWFHLVASAFDHGVEALPADWAEAGRRAHWCTLVSLELRLVRVHR